MAVLEVRQVAQQGVAVPLVAAAAGGDSFVNKGRAWLIVNNASGAAINVTIVSQKACSQGALHPTVIAVAAGAQLWLGPWDAVRYNDGTGKVQVTYSAVVGLTVAVAALPAV